MNRRLAIVAATLALVGCRQTDITGSATIVGDYFLQSINGAGPPISVSATQTVLDDRYTIYRAWTYLRTTRRQTGSTIETTSETGSYTILGTSVTFRASAAGSPELIAAYTANTLTFVVQGQTSVYRKPQD